MAASHRSVELAAELGRLGAHAVVVGGVARLLRTGAGHPHDLDVVVAEPDVDALVSALALLGSSLSARALRLGGCVHVDTAWGPLDVFLGAAPASDELDVAGVRLRVVA
jgi:hypothetical protein